MDLLTVRNAYASVAPQYIELFDGEWDAHEVDAAAFMLRHLRATRGRVLDVGCGPGYWTAYLHEHGLDARGIDVVPQFIEHARVHHPGLVFELRSMFDLAGSGSAAGILSWFSTIHLTPLHLAQALEHYRRTLAGPGMLVLGFFASTIEVGTFDQAVAPAYRWPAEALAERLVEAGFIEVERMQRQVAERPDRLYGALAARAV